ncbi:MAG: rRNA maturation RNase YbeY [Candidatus Aminicenantales bacterium]
MIEIINRQRKYSINQEKIKRLLLRLVEYYELDEAEMCIAFVNTRRIRELNRRFLNRNRPTDVLSFPVGEKNPEGNLYLGDIVISVPEAYNQSIACSHSLERELEHLALHGFLHLIGFDHQEGVEGEEEKKLRKLFIDKG